MKLFHYLSLLGIVLFSLWLRTYKIELSTWQQFGADESRDVLVAEHIIALDEHPHGGPLAAGGLRWLLNSSFYFYVVSLLWFITREPVQFMLLWGTLFGLLPLLAYYLGTQIWDRKLGMLLLLSFSIHQQLIKQGRELLQPNLLPWLAIAFAVFLLDFRKRQSLISLALASFFLYLGLHIHYGVLLMIPVGTVWLWWETWQAFSKTNKLLFLGTTGIASFITGLSWVLATYRIMPFDQIYFLVFNQELHTTINERIHNVATLGLQLWLPTVPPIWRITSLFIWLISIIFLTWRQAIPKHTRSVSNWIFLLAISLGFGLLFKGTFADSYGQIIVPFFLLSVCIALRAGLERYPKIAWVMVGLFLFELAFATYHHMYFILAQPNLHAETKSISQTIYQDRAKYEQPKRFGLIVKETSNYMPYTYWRTSAFWFYLEKFWGEPLVQLVPYANNHKPLQLYPVHVYLICEHLKQVERVSEVCLNEVARLEPDLTQVRTIYQSDWYTVFSYQNKTGKIINKVDL